MELKYDVFISYSHCDRKVAEALCGYLESRGLRCFIDYRDIPRGAFWARIIPPALRASAVMVAVYSDDYNRSVQVERELAIADNSGIPILPFRLSDHPFGDAKSYYFETLNWLDAFPDPEKMFGALADTIAGIVAKGERRQGADTNEPAAAAHFISQDVEAVSTDDYAYEDDYEDGIAQMVKMNYARAAELLIEPAMANYRDAQERMRQLALRDFINLIPPKVWQKVRQEAEKENAFAEYLMARYYSAVDIDDDISFEYSARSARQGNLFGRFDFAKVHELGIGAEKDIDFAMGEFKDLDRRAFGPATVELARQYLYGYNGPRNVSRGLRVLRRGVEAGDINCIQEYGTMLIGGDGVDRDVEKGRELLQQCVDAGLPTALELLADSYLFDYPTGGVNDAESIHRAINLYNLGARKLNPQCMGKLGFIALNHADAAGLAVDPAKGIEWYRKAMELGHMLSMSQLGFAYYYGTGTDENNDEAWRCFWRAHRLTDGTSEYMLGMMCLEGTAPDGRTLLDALGFFENALYLGGWGGGSAAKDLFRFTATPAFLEGFPTKEVDLADLAECPKDDAKALEYLRRGADYDEATCAYLLGCALTDPSRPYADPGEGIEYLEKALASAWACPAANLRLYQVYTQGIGVMPDAAKAREYLDAAAETLGADVARMFAERICPSDSHGSSPNNKFGSGDSKFSSKF